jgi:hypothetical protein
MVSKADNTEIKIKLQNLKSSFAGIGIKDDSGVPAMVDMMIDTVSDENFDRPELLSELDDLSKAMIPELQFEGEDWVVPLVQAGIWLEGSNIIATALLNEEKVGKAKPFLKQPGILKHFLRYVDVEASKKAPQPIITLLKTTLNELLVVAEKEEISKEDLTQVKNSTAKLLQLLQ